eukprot:s832_g9.t2
MHFRLIAATSQPVIAPANFDAISLEWAGCSAGGDCRAAFLILLAEMCFQSLSPHITGLVSGDFAVAGGEGWLYLYDGQTMRQLSKLSAQYFDACFRMGRTVSLKACNEILAEDCKPYSCAVWFWIFAQVMSVEWLVASAYESPGIFAVLLAVTAVMAWHRAEVFVNATNCSCDRRRDGLKEGSPKPVQQFEGHIMSVSALDIVEDRQTPGSLGLQVKEMSPVLQLLRMQEAPTEDDEWDRMLADYEAKQKGSMNGVLERALQERKQLQAQAAMRALRTMAHGCPPHFGTGVLPEGPAASGLPGSGLQALLEQDQTKPGMEAPYAGQVPYLPTPGSTYLKRTTNVSPSTRVGPYETWSSSAQSLAANRALTPFGLGLPPGFATISGGQSKPAHTVPIHVDPDEGLSDEPKQEDPGGHKDAK